jgi:signal transduction histidine kinase
LEQTRTTVHSSIEDPFPVVTIDDAQLKQLFLNLFQNSIEAMGYDGDLSIRIARKHSGGSSVISIEISDTGPGISDSVRSHIFEPFYTTKATGSGLGLAICRSIVDAHRGSIRAQNNADRSGTTVVVELPATDGAALALQASAVRA